MESIFATMTVSSLWATGKDIWTVLQVPVLIAAGLSLVSGIIALGYRYAVRGGQQLGRLGK